jgi:hypothetical protein
LQKTLTKFRYLRERGAAELDNLLSAGFDACKRLKHLNGIELIYVHLCNTASAWDDDRGYFQRAEPRFLECLAIRRKYLDKNNDEISGALHNISLNYLHSMKFDECLDYRQQSLDIIARMPVSTVRDLKAAKQKYTLGRCQTFQGYFVKARVTLYEVLEDLKTLKITDSWFMISL